MTLGPTLRRNAGRAGDGPLGKSVIAGRAGDGPLGNSEIVVELSEAGLRDDCSCKVRFRSISCCKESIVFDWIVLICTMNNKRSITKTKYN